MPSLNTRLEVAKSVAAPLIELEKQIDAALGAHSAVLIAAIEGRRKARLPLHSGQAGLEQLVSAADRLIAARKAVHEAHLVFRDVQDAMGLGVVAYGDYGDTPREMQTLAPSLTVVAAA